MRRKTVFAVLAVILIPVLVSCSAKETNDVTGNTTAGAMDHSSYVAAANTADEGNKIQVESPMTLSSTMCTLNGKTAYLRLKMVEGRYYEDWNPGPFMGTIWEGYYIAELADEYGNTVMQTDFSKLYNSGSEPLTFRFWFDFELDDYNGDGDPDFTAGQYGSSNGMDYKLFTIRKDGRIEELPVKDYPTLFISNTTGYYSTKLEKISSTSFKREYYDNSKGKHIEDTFEWNGREFIQGT